MAAEVSIESWLASHTELPDRDLELLLAHIARIPKARTLTSPKTILPAATLIQLECCAGKLVTGQPLAYVLGHWEFWGLEFAINPSVLIPRPETETLVELILKRAKPGARVLDLGTGSAAIAVALASERSDLHITATDNHSNALATARANAERHNCSIKFILSDWFGALDGRWDLIITNPPYIADGDPHLPALLHEPLHALTAGRDGLDDIRTIISQAPDHLAERGMLALEHGYDQADAVAELMRTAGFVSVETIEDLARIPRVTHGTYREAPNG